MTERRFTLDDEENGLCRCILVDGEEMPTCEICELLNEQQDIIQSLQKDIMEMSDGHQSYIEMDSETHSKINDIIHIQRKKIFRLEKENRDLRQRLDFYLLEKIIDGLDEFEWKERYGD